MTPRPDAVSGVQRVHIRWDSSSGAYCMTTPAWEGVAVVLAADYDALRAQNAELVKALDLAREFVSYPTTPDRDYSKEERWAQLRAALAKVQP